MSGGMTTRKIQGHLEAIHGVEASPGLISAITGAVTGAITGAIMEEVTARPAPLDPCYPIVFMGAIGVDIRTGGRPRTRRSSSPSRFCPTAGGAFRGLGFMLMRAQDSGPGSRATCATQSSGNNPPGRFLTLLIRSRDPDHHRGRAEGLSLKAIEAAFRRPGSRPALSIVCAMP